MRMRVLAAFAAAVLLSGCGSGDHQALDNPAPAQFGIPQHSVSVSDVGQSPRVSVSCMDFITLMCEIEWTGNEFSDDAIVYRSTVDDPSTATEIGRVWAEWPFFSDRTVARGTRYFYWVRFEDSGGKQSPLSPSASGCAVDFGQSCTPVVAAEPDRDPVDPRLPFQRVSGETPYQPLRQPRLVTEARQAPVYHDGVHLFVGVDQGRDALNDLETARADKRGSWTLRHASVSDGISAAQIAGYLRESAKVKRIEDGTPVVLRFTSPPVVRFGGAAATAADVDRLLRAVQIVNASLPMAWRMEMPSGVPEDAPDPKDGIYVEFLPASRFTGNSLGSAETAWFQDGTIPYATISINKGYRANDEDGALHVLIHELVHALGLGHVSSRFQSVMKPHLHSGSEDSPSILYPVDRAALRAVYGRMEAGDAYNDFGAWDDASTYLLGNGDHVAFGAVWRNGYAEPWAYGYLPDTDLGDNPRLFGTVRWSGLLLGFTPTAKSVTGNASLRVNMTDLTGSASFTRLESWRVGAVPGNAGLGTRWGDGSLYYGIAVTGNTFVQTGGDEGLVTGAFFGASHEGMGGVVHRDDLTAAFGGQR